MTPQVIDSSVRVIVLRVTNCFMKPIKTGDFAREDQVELSDSGCRKVEVDIGYQLS